MQQVLDGTIVLKKLVNGHGRSVSAMRMRIDDTVELIRQSVRDEDFGDPSERPIIRWSFGNRRWNFPTASPVVIYVTDHSMRDWFYSSRFGADRIDFSIVPAIHAGLPVLLEQVQRIAPPVKQLWANEIARF